MRDAKIRGLIDRIEGDKVVVLLGEEEREVVEFPVSCLPEGVREGDILTFKIKLESRRSREAKAKVAEMIKKLTS